MNARPLSAPLGSTIDEIDTPALCLDLDILEANIRAVADECRRHGVGWRPHFKGNKVPAIAELEIAAGAHGITCAKLGEAEVLAAETRITDVLVANVVVGPQKICRLVELRRKADPIVCVDDLAQAEPIGRAMADAGLRQRLLIEVDLGLARVGVAHGDATLRLAQSLAQLEGVELAGIMGYEGHLLTVADHEEKDRRIREALGHLVATKELLERNDIACGIVSCGGTGSYQHAVRVHGITEVQAGGAIFMDAFYRTACNVTHLGYAMTLVATVVSRPAADRAVMDAGRKALNIEVQTPLIVNRDDVRVKKLSAEHGWLDVDPTSSLRVGDRLSVVPGYADLTAVLHDCFYGFRGGRLESIMPLAARGKLQ